MAACKEAKKKKRKLNSSEWWAMDTYRFHSSSFQAVENCNGKNCSNPDCSTVSSPVSWWGQIWRHRTHLPCWWNYAALNSCTWLEVASGKQTVLHVMSALECPCQSKGGGILNDPSCWLTLDVRWRGVSKKSCFFCLFFLKLMVSAMPFPVNRDSASPSGMHVQIGLSHMISRGSYSMPFLSIWLAAISMTLMMNAMAKAQMRLFLTHVWRFFFEGWTEMKMKKNRILKHK